MRERSGVVVRRATRAAVAGWFELTVKVRGKLGWPRASWFELRVRNALRLPLDLLAQRAPSTTTSRPSPVIRRTLAVIPRRSPLGPETSNYTSVFAHTSGSLARSTRYGRTSNDNMGGDARGSGVLQETTSLLVTKSTS